MAIHTILRSLLQRYLLLVSQKRKKMDYAIFQVALIAGIVSFLSMKVPYGPHVTIVTVMTDPKDEFNDSLNENGLGIDYDAETDAFTKECKEFMNNFVTKMFSANNDITQEEKAQFGLICQHAPARKWFARYINLQRGDNKCVDEITFFRLVQYFATVLFECHQADDFAPAKTLMNMCFTFCHVFKTGRSGEIKEFLHVYLRDQPIWHGLRFWDAAFLDSVHCERQSPTLPRADWNNLSDNDKQDHQEHDKNRIFGQLGTFANNMKAFGLPKAACRDFIQKMSIIGDLSKEQIALLQQNFEDV